MIDPGSKIANESHYYMGEALFQISEYSEAAIIFDRYVRFSSNISKIESARYRICECAVKSSNIYQREQSQTLRALEQLQLFIEDFPTSDMVHEAEEAIDALRLKLAQKDYEAGRMYLKLEEYESALIYFKAVLNNNHSGAKHYFHAETTRFLSKIKFDEADALVGDTENGLKLNHYIKLYK